MITRSDIVEAAAKRLCAEAGLDPNADIYMAPVPPGYKGVLDAQGRARVPLWHVRAQEVENFLRLTEAVKFVIGHHKEHGEFPSYPDARDPILTALAPGK